MKYLVKVTADGKAETYTTDADSAASAMFGAYEKYGLCGVTVSPATPGGLAALRRHDGSLSGVFRREDVVEQVAVLASPAAAILTDEQTSYRAAETAWEAMGRNRDASDSFLLFLEGYRAALAAPVVPAEAIGHVSACEDYGVTIKWTNGVPAIGTAIYRAPVVLVDRNAVLEEAAQICDSVNNYDDPRTARDCAEAIRALKSAAPASPVDTAIANLDALLAERRAYYTRDPSNYTDPKS